MIELNYFSILNTIDVSKKIEKKGNLSYLSWAFAWGELKKLHPDATSTVYERPDGRIYWDDGKTAWVKTGITVNGLEHIEYLPIMDFKNASVAVENIKSTEVNKTIQRSLTKAIARHGLGLYIYAGEDLPEQETEEKAPQKPAMPLMSKINPAVKAETMTQFAKYVSNIMKTATTTPEIMKAFWVEKYNADLAKCTEAEIVKAMEEK